MCLSIELVLFVIRRMRKGIFIVILYFFVCFVMIPLRVVLLAVLQKNIFFILMTTGILFRLNILPTIFIRI